MDTDIFENTGSAEEQYEEELTAAEVLQKLEDAWLNEKHAPELLESKMEIVECMLDQVKTIEEKHLYLYLIHLHLVHLYTCMLQVKTMEENLAKVKKGDIRVPVHRMEIQRIKFMANSYLRLRLRKIQSNIFSVTRGDQDTDNPSRMTPEESEFSASYRQLLTSHFDSLVLRHLPGGWDPDKVAPNPAKPLTDTAVFVSVKEDVAGVEIRDQAELGRDDTLDLVRGAQHMFQYRDISHLLEAEQVQLI